MAEAGLEGEVGWNPITEVDAGDGMAEVTVVRRAPVSGLMSRGLRGPPKVAASRRLGSIMDISLLLQTLDCFV